MISSNWWFFICAVPSIILHEVAHGWVADVFGDHTARERHRLTLNPIAHIDLIGTILMPAILILAGLPVFGYAKPVPVNPRRLRKPRSQMLYVSLAGPAVNVLLSIVGFVVSRHALSTNSQELLNFGLGLGLSNLLLAGFNLLPIPPLDGSAIIERFIPVKHLPRYYHFRQRVVPFFFIFIIVDYQFLHVGTNWLYDLQTWWINRL